MINLGNIKLDPSKVLLQLEQDLKDDWFQDPLKFKDILSDPIIADLITNNYSNHSGKYQANQRDLFNVPKPNFTLRYGLETGLPDRVIFHGLTSFLIPYFDSLIPWCVFSHRYNNGKKGDKYIFKRGVPAWQDFIGNVRAILSEDAVLLSTDLTNYFENINIEVLRQVFHSLMDDIEATHEEKIEINNHLDLLFECLERWCYSKRNGLPQNRDASSFLANIYMLAVDKHMLDRGFRYFRYMDDIKIVCSDKFEARRALKILSLKLRELGLSVNSGKTKILSAVESGEINDTLDAGGEELQHIDAIWQTRSLAVISRSFPALRELSLTLLASEKADSREFRFCIKRLEMIAQCSEFAVPAEYFKPITPHIIDAIPSFPAAVDQFVKYLLSVELTTDQLEKISSFLTDENLNFYTWQVYKLWFLFLHKNHHSDHLIAYALNSVKSLTDTPSRAGASLYLGMVGDLANRIEVADNFSTLKTFLGQRAALISIHELPYRPYIEDKVKPYLRDDLHGVYKNLKQFKKYIVPPEKTHISSIIDDGRIS